MAPIKIQSLQDVARVYLQTLGYQHAAIGDRDIAFFLSSLKLQTETAEELVEKADEILLDNALNVFNEIFFEKRQTVAYFKLFFSLFDGAKICPIKDLVAGKLPKELTEKMQRQAVITAPEYNFEHMRPQKIDEVHWFSRIFSCFKRGKQS